jgi:transcriptional regulator with XRE-family HTH domain
MARPTQPIDQSTLRGQIGARIRARRLRCKLSVAEAAARAGMAVPTWYHAESGRSLSLDRLAAIAAALGCALRALLP